MTYQNHVPSPSITEGRPSAWLVAHTFGPCYPHQAVPPYGSTAPLLGERGLTHHTTTMPSTTTRLAATSMPNVAPLMVSSSSCWLSAALTFWMHSRVCKKGSHFVRRQRCVIYCNVYPVWPLAPGRTRHCPGFKLKWVSVPAWLVSCSYPKCGACVLRSPAVCSRHTALVRG